MNWLHLFSSPIWKFVDVGKLKEKRSLRSPLLLFLEVRAEKRTCFDGLESLPVCVCFSFIVSLQYIVILFNQHYKLQPPELSRS